MNLGERNEYLAKFYLTLLRDSADYPEVRSVSFDHQEYRSLPTDIHLNNIHLLAAAWNDHDIKKLAASIGMSKAPSRAKSDIAINGINYSLKYTNAAPPAIVNHTARHGFLKICAQLQLDLTPVDHMLESYWDLRERGIIREDVPNSSEHSPFKKKDPTLVRLVEYFLFEGTGAGRSPFPAQAVIEFSNPFDYRAMHIIKPEQIIDAIWDKLVFSVRSKGMPDSYQLNGTSQRDRDITPWTRERDGKLKGALHIRVKK